MERYKMVNGSLVPPPCGGVTAEGRVISNFAARVRRDPVFAMANGYYPLAESEGESVELLEEESEIRLDYVLRGGAWALERVN